MDDKILVTKEDGTEVELTILLTFENEELGYKYGGKLATRLSRN